MNKFFISLRANFTKFLQDVAEREKYTKTLKKENTFEQFVQMNIETNKCISAAKCDFPTWNVDRTYDNDNDVHVRCDCFTPIHNCLRRINTTLPNQQANRFFISNGGFGCYNEDYPIVRCSEFGYSHILKMRYIRYRGQIKRCVRYELDKSKPKEYQKFDVPVFYDSKDPNEFILNNAITMRYDIRSMLVAFIELVANIDLTFWFIWITTFNTICIFQRKFFFFFEKEIVKNDSIWETKI